MTLGAFSISLAVKDIAASRAFCEKFGFAVFAGDQSNDPGGNPILVDQHV
jgi:predicted lactoylglutathione lyase